MVTAGGTPLDAAAMDLMPNLGAIVCYGTGYDGVDLAAAAKRKIVVAHSPGANASSVADIAVTLMLAATRRLLPADDYVRTGGWVGAKPSPMMRPQAGMRGRRSASMAWVRSAARSPRGRGIRDRSRLFEPQPARRALSIFSEARGAGGMVQRADDRGARGRRHRKCRRCRYPEELGADGYVVNISQRLGDRSAGAGCSARPTIPSRAPDSMCTSRSRMRRMR